MAKKIMIGNHKGGAAKTQTSLEMAYWLAMKGNRVLFIDIDPQANATKILSKDTPTGKRTLPDILIAGDEIKHEDISSYVLDKDGHHIDFIECGLKAGRMEPRLSNETPKEYVLKDALDNIEKEYDYILIDTPPSAEINVICSLVASDYILLTCNAAMFGADGVDKLIPIITGIQKRPRMNPNLRVLGILVTLYDNNNDCNQTVDDLHAKYGDLVLIPFIRRTTKVCQSNRRFSFILKYRPTSTSACDYKQAFELIFNRKRL